ncbi:MAG: hypothetical protein RLZZ416_590 [Candidatus Parcubacteria bacterium]|jgi:hypothetical protein
MSATVVDHPSSIIERVIEAGSSASPDDIAELKRHWAETARPVPDHVEALIPILHSFGEHDFLGTHCPHEYDDWQHEDAGDREYGGPPLPESEELHPED